MQHILEDGPGESGADGASRHASTVPLVYACRPCLGATIRMVIMYGSCKSYQSDRLSEVLISIDMAIQVYLQLLI